MAEKKWNHRHSTKEVVPQPELSQPGLEPVWPNYIPPHHLEYYMHTPYDSKFSPEIPKPRVCGLRQHIFWLAVALAAALALIVGLGAGLGVSMGKEASRNNMAESLVTSPTATSSTAAATSTPGSPSSSPSGLSAVTSIVTIPPVGTATLTLPAFRAAATPASICPSANNTLVQAVKGSMRYHYILCDSSFGEYGRQTLSSAVLPTFGDCLNMCSSMNRFQDREDVGCTWNAPGTGGEKPGTCWCYGGVNKLIVSSVGNVVATPLDSSPDS
ncbi:hypothetical protein B0T25DRAFT_129969 [Lasiosphaeria hispida]|uniref:Apple domain-containing protein n=1 Tax=Lasiosphaeria hispida TaxID=260671 RepID=A0AAJ0MIL0_9PEZI|nr:hypothetical protein B0T25DRAFT_129969 [Lasiosphaeria hispida]